MKKLLIISFLCCWVGASIGQQSMLKQTTEDAIGDKKFGPGAKFYFHPVPEYAMMSNLAFDDNSHMNLNPGNSFRLASYYRTKSEMTRWFGWGLDYGFSFNNYALEQDEFKVFPQPIIYKRERMMTATFYSAGFLRFNFLRKRGDHFGKYIDLAYFGEYMLWSRHVYKYKNPDGSDVKWTKVVNKKLDYLQKLSYGPEIRWGNAIGSVFGRYRISDFFNAPSRGSSIPELPRFVFGIQMNARAD